MTVSILFVQGNSIYKTLGYDSWDAARDATLYRGPNPVVAHPPCGYWGKYAKQHGILGKDGGLFEFALSAVREWGGVLEHPKDSYAFKEFGLGKPVNGAWTRSADGIGWITTIQQWAYGHRAPKETWLYAVSERKPHDLLWDQRAPRATPQDYPELPRGQAMRRTLKDKA